ncbi:MAG TPA: hypothetical protein VM925_32265 [Labilithrix sp.]|jgi:hypothetical protein|nr:hypothetical protein [Labilithrix sp.]
MQTIDYASQGDAQVAAPKPARQLQLSSVCTRSCVLARDFSATIWHE